MAANILDQIESVFDEETTQRAAQLLGIKEQALAASLRPSIAAVIGASLKRSRTSDGAEHLFREVRAFSGMIHKKFKTSILANGFEGIVEIGKRISEDVLNEEFPAICEHIATDAKIDKASAEKALHLITPFVFDLAGEEKVARSLNRNGVTKYFEVQQTRLTTELPYEILETMGLTSTNLYSEPIEIGQFSPGKPPQKFTPPLRESHVAESPTQSGTTPADELTANAVESSSATPTPSPTATHSATQPFDVEVDFSTEGNNEATTGIEIEPPIVVEPTTETAQGPEANNTQSATQCFTVDVADVDATTNESAPPETNTNSVAATSVAPVVAAVVATVAAATDTATQTVASPEVAIPPTEPVTDSTVEPLEPAPVETTPNTSATSSITQPQGIEPLGFETSDVAPTIELPTETASTSAQQPVSVEPQQIVETQQLTQPQPVATEPPQPVETPEAVEPQTTVVPPAAAAEPQNLHRNGPQETISETTSTESATTEEPQDEFAPQAMRFNRQENISFLSKALLPLCAITALWFVSLNLFQYWKAGNVAGTPDPQLAITSEAPNLESETINEPVLTEAIEIDLTDIPAAYVESETTSDSFAEASADTNDLEMTSDDNEEFFAEASLDDPFELNEELPLEQMLETSHKFVTKPVTVVFEPLQSGSHPDNNITGFKRIGDYRIPVFKGTRPTGRSYYSQGGS